MEQQSVYLHTGISFEEASEIFKDQGWEIIYKSHNDEIYFDTLTEDEKISWLEAFEGSIKTQTHNLHKHDKKDGSFIISTDKVKQRFEKVYDMLKNKQISVPEKYESIVSEMRIIDEIIGQVTGWLNYIFERGYPIYERKLQCSRIIAKKGSEKIQYLEFFADPIITVTGPKAASAKSTLESIF